jgi:hypothetical protein
MPDPASYSPTVCVAVGAVLAAIDLAEVAALNGLWGHGRAVEGNRPYREQRDLHAGAHKARPYKKERERARWPTGWGSEIGRVKGRRPTRLG